MADELHSSDLTAETLPVTFIALKAFVASILILGLISPLCLCGEAVTESHAATAEALSSCQAGHHHHPERDSDEPDSEHSHSHSEVRMSVSNEIPIPAASDVELMDWSIVAVRLDGEFAPAAIAFPKNDSMRPPPWEESSRAISGVFLI